MTSAGTGLMIRSWWLIKNTWRLLALRSLGPTPCVINQFTNFFLGLQFYFTVYVQYTIMYWNLKICRNPQKSKGAPGLSLPSSPPSYSLQLFNHTYFLIGDWTVMLHNGESYNTCVAKRSTDYGALKIVQVDESCCFFTSHLQYFRGLSILNS